MSVSTGHEKKVGRDDEQISMSTLRDGHPAEEETKISDGERIAAAGKRHKNDRGSSLHLRVQRSGGLDEHTMLEICGERQ